MTVLILCKQLPVHLGGESSAPTIRHSQLAHLLEELAIPYCLLVLSNTDSIRRYRASGHNGKSAPTFVNLHQITKWVGNHKGFTIFSQDNFADLAPFCGPKNKIIWDVLADKPTELEVAGFGWGKVNRTKAAFQKMAEYAALIIANHTDLLNHLAVKIRDKNSFQELHVSDLPFSAPIENSKSRSFINLGGKIQKWHQSQKIMDAVDSSIERTSSRGVLFFGDLPLHTDPLSLPISNLYSRGQLAHYSSLSLPHYKLLMSRSSILIDPTEQSAERSIALPTRATMAASIGLPVVRTHRSLLDKLPVTPPGKVLDQEDIVASLTAATDEFESFEPNLLGLEFRSYLQEQQIAFQTWLEVNLDCF